MEFLSARLSEKSSGSCGSCQRDEVVLEAAIMEIQDDPGRKNALGQPIKVGVKAHLMCGECALNHPLWRLTNDKKKAMATASS